MTMIKLKTLLQEGVNIAEIDNQYPLTEHEVNSREILVNHAGDYSVGHSDPARQQSGYYKGLYVTTDKNLAAKFGKNIKQFKLKPDIKLWAGNEKDLKSLARKAGFMVHSANGNAEVEYLKKLGYAGIQRGVEIVLFDPDSALLQENWNSLLTVKNYWLDKNGGEHKVAHHNQLAAKLSGKDLNSDESFQWMFDRGWARINIEDGTIYINTSLTNPKIITLTNAQKTWIKTMRDADYNPLEVCNIYRRRIEL
jgi:hypothetical protein